MSLNIVGVWGPVTAVPGVGLSREQTLSFLISSLGLSERRSQWLNSLMDQAGIDWRYTCVDEFCHTSEQQEIPRGAEHWESVLGGLDGRMARYGRHSVALAETAGRQVLEQSGLAPGEVTHLVFVTCTGFENPGPDAELVDRLGLPATVHRLQVGFMGCQAAVQGLRLADSICRSEPEAVVLLICIELGTLHFNPARTDREHLVVSSIFGDGAAAALISRRELAVAPSYFLDYFHSQRVSAGADFLSWKLGEPAFTMGLGRELPDLVRTVVGPFVRSLLPQATPGDRTGWVLHPGGRAVIDAVQETLCLSDEQVAPTRGVLAKYGNMSSPTLLFVMAAMPPCWRSGVALAFGPGLSIEGFQWSRPAASRIW